MAIDKNVIVNGVSQMNFKGNDKGLIETFGVYLTSGSSSLYNNLCFNYLKSLDKSLIKEAEKLLVNAAKVCGYNTFHGIQTSVEWEGLIQPMVENDTDKLLASIEICNALGWVKWEIVDLDPGRKSIIRAYSGYEAELYMRDFGQSNLPVCYMLQGVASTLNDLSFGDAYPSGLFTFDTVETKCRAKGDSYCEFITTL